MHPTCIVIDGSQGEGGGQILRTSLSLAALLRKQVQVTNIRAGRPKPGLARAHMTAVLAAAEVSGGSLVGCEIGSTTITYTPPPPSSSSSSSSTTIIPPSTYTFDIGSAGSTTLVLQTILPILLFHNIILPPDSVSSAIGKNTHTHQQPTTTSSSTIPSLPPPPSSPITVIIQGGTHNPMAPPIEFLQECFIPQLERMIQGYCSVMGMTGGTASREDGNTSGAGTSTTTTTSSSSSSTLTSSSSSSSSSSSPRIHKHVQLFCDRPGFAPAGGGILRAIIHPLSAPLHKHQQLQETSSSSSSTSSSSSSSTSTSNEASSSPSSSSHIIYNLLEKGKLLGVYGKVLISNLAINIAERELKVLESAPALKTVGIQLGRGGGGGGGNRDGSHNNNITNGKRPKNETTTTSGSTSGDETTATLSSSTLEKAPTPLTCGIIDLSKTATGPGNAVQILSVYENVSELTSCCGERSLKAEQVASTVQKEACQYLHQFPSSAPVSTHLADQLLLPLSILSWSDRSRSITSAFRTAFIDEHFHTNATIIEIFLGKGFISLTKVVESSSSSAGEAGTGGGAGGGGGGGGVKGVDVFEARIGKIK